MVIFGPQGNSEAFYHDGRRSTWQVIGWLDSLGLNGYEYAYGRGFRVGDETLAKIKEQKEKFSFHISCEALYYTNLASPMVDNQIHYFEESLRVANGIGAERLVFHPGTCGDMSRDEAFAAAKKNLSTIIAELRGAGMGDMILCPQIMDESNDIGTLDEIIELCAIDECVYPGMAFGHLQALTRGSLKTKEDYAAVLDKVKAGVGGEKYKHMHIDFTHVTYSPKGEREHLTFADRTWGPFFEPLAELIAERDLEPWCMCTSKNTQAEDAVTMRKMYEAAREKVS